MEFCEFISSSCRVTIGILFLLALLMVMKGIIKDLERLEDFCIANTKSYVFTNKFPYHDPTKINSQHFLTSFIRMPVNTSSSPMGASFIRFNPQNLSGLNTVEIMLVHINMAMRGVVGPNIHPRGSEILQVSKEVSYFI